MLENRFLIKPQFKVMGKFVITKRSNGEFQFNLKAGNGQNILASEGYSTKANCENGIESVKKNSQEDAKFDRKTSSNGKFYFNLKATNGQIIGTSEMYESEASRDNGIDSVKTNAADATVDDQSN
jgi:uncharacterized protein YegP (UPF0339 family)